MAHCSMHMTRHGECLDWCLILRACLRSLGKEETLTRAKQGETFFEGSLFHLLGVVSYRVWSNIGCELAEGRERSDDKQQTTNLD